MGSMTETMAAGRYNLSWNYEERCATMFEAFLNIQQREDYSDVTLVTEDDQVMKAHRVILGACSSFFGNIFQKTNTRDLCLYLPGIVQKDLQAILDFVYNGQTDIPADSLDTFTKAADQLRIKGLAAVDPVEENTDLCETNLANENLEYTMESFAEEQNMSEIDNGQFTIETSLEEITEEEANTSTVYQLDATQVKVEIEGDTDDTIVNKTVITEEMSQAIDSASKGNKHKCDHCDFVCARKDRLKRHVAYAHTTVDWVQCTKCEYAAKDKDELKQHTESNHKRVSKAKKTKSPNVFPCDKCDYRARTSENLERHIKFIVHKPKVE